MNDFSNHPISITEAKANKAEDCAVWTPRDALIHMLRELDSGRMEFDSLVVCGRQKKPTEDCPTGYTIRYAVSAPNTTAIIGLLEETKLTILLED